MDKNLTRWTQRCAICGLLLVPLAAHQAGLPTSCKCTPRYTVEQQVTAPPEQPDSWPEVLQVLPEQVSAQTNWVSASFTVPYESLQRVSSGST
jgi:hypothetical protein